LSGTTGNWLKMSFYYDYTRSVIMKRVLVCGVANSKNLGDRLIAATVNYIIQLSRDQYQISNFDITVGKVGKFSDDAKVKLNSISTAKKLIPDFMRSMKVLINYKKNYKLASELKESIFNSDIVVIGGGHLLIDNYLNFPIGINNIIKEARINNIPVIFSFVGAKGPWSKLAKKFFLDALHYAEYISVRDSDSKKFLISIDHNLEKKIIVLSDPALFVNELYGNNKTNYTKKIGLGIMDPNLIRKHSNLYWSREDSATWWSVLIKKLIALGYEVTIFTNGDPTDNGFVDNFIKLEVSNIKGVSFNDYPRDYEDIIATIEKQDLIIAQRLHACLPSISLMKHTFGVMWDKKLESIFNDLGLNDYIIDFNDDVESVVKKILNKIDNSCVLDKSVLEIIDTKKREMIDFVEKRIDL
jgi:polysaccharide pyruvyl transferase WcaK-like protein